MVAVTRIWPVRDNLKRVLEYADNHLKTANPAHYTPEEMRNLFDVLEYAKDGEKTERERFVTGIRCNDETAFAQMMLTKERFGKTGGNLAYHAYQSFRPEEVTPEQGHEIGVELAKWLWGDRFEVLVTTHLNTNCVHNHFVINSVSFLDGKKFNNNYAMYFTKFRRLSDEICQEKKLSVIDHPKGKTPRALYFAEKNGEPTRYNLMREAIDRAAGMTKSMEQFRRVLYRMGYVMDTNPNHKYATIRSVNSKKATRMVHLGEEYQPEAIAERVWQNPLGVQEKYLDFLHPERHHWSPPRKMQYKGSFQNMCKVTGLEVLFLFFLHLLGVYPREHSTPQRQPLSPEMREQCRKMESYSKQARLIGRKHFKTEDDVKAFLSGKYHELDALKSARDKCYNRLRRCSDPKKSFEIKAERDGLTAKMAACRKDIASAENILEHTQRIRELIRIEMQTRAELYPPAKQKMKTERGNIR